MLKRFPTTGEQVLMGPGEGAGVVDIGGGLGIAFKMGIPQQPKVRCRTAEERQPVLAASSAMYIPMGARPITILNSLRFGSLLIPESGTCLKRPVRGMAWYGNETELPV